MNISFFIDKDELFSILGKYNFGIELTEFISKDRLFNYKANIANAIKDLKEIDEIALHAPFDNLSPCSSIKKIKEMTELQYTYIYEIAEKLGATSIIFHTGYNPNKDSFENSLKNAVRFWQKFTYGKEHINFYIENLLEQNCAFQLQLHDKVSRPNLKICLDIGHSNKNSPYSVEEWIQQLNNRIGYVHLHNNNGIEDEHKGINNGTANIRHILDNLLLYAPNAIWTLETSEVTESIEWLFQNEYIFIDTAKMNKKSNPNKIEIQKKLSQI